MPGAFLCPEITQYLPKPKSHFMRLIMEREWYDMGGMQGISCLGDYTAAIALLALKIIVKLPMHSLKMSQY